MRAREAAASAPARRAARAWAAALAVTLVAAGCGAPAQEAEGLRFEAPQGYEVRRERVGRAQAFVLVGSDAALVLAWSPAPQVPDAAAVVAAALRARGAPGEGYAVAEVVDLRTVEVAGTQADYVETVWVARDGSGPPQQARMAVFAGPRATYLAALVEEAGRGTPAGAAAWDRFLASLHWEGR